MTRRRPENPDRRTVLKLAPLALAGGLDRLAGRAAADTPPSTAEPKLAPKPAVQEKLASLKPNRAILLGKADVVGEFNDTARKYDLHKTGPRGRDFTIKMCWAPDRGRATWRKEASCQRLQGPAVVAADVPANGRARLPWARRTVTGLPGASKRSCGHTWTSR